MVLRDDGLVQGSVSGGCIEDDLIARMGAGEFAGTAARVARYGVTAEEARRFGLPCGGTLELVIEPAPDPAGLEELATRIGAGQLARRTVDLARGSAFVGSGSPADAVAWDGQRLVTVHGPAWRLLLIGAGQISRFLAPLAQTLGYRVLVCDPRVEYSAEWDVAGADLLPGMPDDVVVELALDPRSAVVALTHDPRLDDLALLEALKSPAFYVGALGSRASNASRRQRLRQYFDLTEGEIARLHGPVGLPIGSRTPPEIAVAIVAEMTAVKNGVAARSGQSADSVEAPSAAPAASAGCCIR